MSEDRVEATAERIVGSGSHLRDKVLFLGAIERWRQERARATIRAPGLDIHRVRYLTIGDIRIDIPSGWS